MILKMCRDPTMSSDSAADYNLRLKEFARRQYCDEGRGAEWSDNTIGSMALSKLDGFKLRIFLIMYITNKRNPLSVTASVLRWVRDFISLPTSHAA